MYSESFSPNGATPPIAEHRRAVRDERYKLIRETGQDDLLFDLEADPFETANLLPTTNPDELAAYAALVAELELLGVD